MLVKTKNGFDFMSGSVLLQFLKMHTDKAGKVTERIELAQFVPIAKAAQGAEAEGEKSGGLFHWVFSSYVLDRANERVDCSGWDIKHFEQNPVILWAHNHYVPAIGYAQNVRATDDLQGDIIFNEKETDAFGWSIGQRVAFGSIRAGSVGFLIKEIEFVDNRKKPDEKAEIIYRKQELLEFSVCNVPMNPQALYEGGAGKSVTRSADNVKYDFFTTLKGVGEWQ